MNIAQEIYESIQELYQEIIKVDLKTGKATILHSITDPSDRGKECIWDSQLEKYMKNKIQPSDHERMRDNFCLRHLRNECEKGKGLFSNNFSTMNGNCRITMLRCWRSRRETTVRKRFISCCARPDRNTLCGPSRISMYIDLRLFYLSGREA